MGNKEFINSLSYFLKTLVTLLKSFYKAGDLEKSESPKNLLFLAALFVPSNIRETSLGDMEET